VSAAWPLVKRRLVELLPTLDGWDAVEVYDGPPVTSDAPRAYVTVGYVLDEDFGGSYSQTRNGSGWQGGQEESGTVRSEVVCSTGEVDIADVEDRAFALVDAWEAEVGKDERLGVLGPSSTSSLAVDVQPVQTTTGAQQRLIVTLTYFARIP
jgi:hypothetical protein